MYCCIVARTTRLLVSRKYKRLREKSGDRSRSREIALNDVGQ